MTLNTSQGTIGALQPNPGDFPANHQFYVREFIDIANPELVYDMFGTPKNIEPNSSNTIRFNKVLKLSTTENSPLTEGVTPTEQVFTLERIEKAINQFGGFAVTTDRLTEESINGLTSEFNMRIAEQGGETMNKVLRDDLLGGINIRFANGVLNADAITTSGMFVSDFTFMFQAFKNEKVKPIRPMTLGSENIGTLPTRETYPVIIPVEASDEVEALNDSLGNSFINTERYGSQRATWMNEYGTYKQFTFILDTEGKTFDNTAGTPQTIAQTLVFGRGAYHTTLIGASEVDVIIKPLGSAGSADPIDQRASIGWKAKKGAVIVQPTYMFQYQFSLGDAA